MMHSIDKSDSKNFYIVTKVLKTLFLNAFNSLKYPEKNQYLGFHIY